MGSFPLGMKQLGGALKYLRLRLPHCSVFLSATFYSPTSGVVRTVGCGFISFSMVSGISL